MERRQAHNGERLAFTRVGAEVGTLFLPAGTRVPAEGQSVHAQDELSFILSGRMVASSGGETCTLGAGDVTLIPAGEAHWAEVIEDVTLAYVLLEPRP
ncbi:cupin domain-containing protein [Deinococcus pimensis]|uniref:cupin domain-containing protein n=1 Tax=Deinococcus pimensis TaxID=309888 RepID=UPI0004AF643E|nr:cupin domain-containing protein [Deinococcus pimensis]